ncbi:MAG: YraN family protein [Actinomycetota bacterium]
MSTAKLGSLAEALAADLLSRAGVEILARNRRVTAGEIDIVGAYAGSTMAVEVRSTRAGPFHTHPLDAFDYRKQQQVRSVAVTAGYTRVDLVAVRFSTTGVDLHWIGGAA